MEQKVAEIETLKKEQHDQSQKENLLQKELEFHSILINQKNQEIESLLIEKNEFTANFN